MKEKRIIYFFIIILVLIIVGLIFLLLVSGVLFYVNAEYYDVTYNCIDEMNGRFQDEICEKEIVCDLKSPSFFAENFNSKLCSEVKV